jgi:RNA polymerase sigma-70 factor (ECF subfamily)
MAASETDEELLACIHSGDEQAFVSLYRKRQGAIFRFALHMSGSEAVAEDVTQEVFLAVIRDRFGFDATRGTLSGYLFGIARKLVLRYIERGRLDVALDSGLEETVLPELAVADDPLLDLTHREGLDALRRAVLALPRRYREVVVLCDLEEMDYADAAVALGCPIGTVRSRLHRARALLLEKLNQDRHARPAVPSLKPARCFV